MASKKHKAPEFAAMRTRQPEVVAMLARQGGGKHDSRPNRQRTRSAARRAAIAVSW